MYIYIYTHIHTYIYIYMYLTKNIFGLCWCVVCLFEFEWHTPLVQTYQHTRWMPRSAYFLRGPAHMFLEYVWQIFGKHYLCIVEDTGCKYIFTCHPNKCLASFPRCPKYLVDYIYIYIWSIFDQCRLAVWGLPGAIWGHLWQFISFKDPMDKVRHVGKNDRFLDIYTICF